MTKGTTSVIGRLERLWSIADAHLPCASNPSSETTGG